MGGQKPQLKRFAVAFNGQMNCVKQVLVAERLWEKFSFFTFHFADGEL